MRASRPSGKFSTKYELDSMLDGIEQDLQHPVGQEVDWWLWDSTATVLDPIYGVGSSGDSTSGGRRWKSPFKMPVINAQVFQGQTMQNDRGFYNTDILRVTVSMNDVRRKIPDLITTPDLHLRDRVIFRNEIFRPTRLYLRGQVLTTYTILTIDLTQVAPEELVNDEQFNTLFAN